MVRTIFSQLHSKYFYKQKQGKNRIEKFVFINYMKNKAFAFNYLLLLNFIGRLGEPLQP